MVVVGGRNSNNTRQLVLRCQEQGIPAYHVQGPEDLRPEWFERVEAVGLTAGTSTLDETIAAVQERWSASPPAVAVSSLERGDPDPLDFSFRERFLSAKR